MRVRTGEPIPHPTPTEVSLTARWSLHQRWSPAPPCASRRPRPLAPAPGRPPGLARRRPPDRLRAARPSRPARKRPVRPRHDRPHRPPGPARVALKPPGSGCSGPPSSSPRRRRRPRPGSHRLSGGAWVKRGALLRGGGAASGSMVTPRCVASSTDETTWVSSRMTPAERGSRGPISQFVVAAGGGLRQAGHGDDGLVQGAGEHEGAGAARGLDVDGAGVQEADRTALACWFAGGVEGPGRALQGGVPGKDDHRDHRGGGGEEQRQAGEGPAAAGPVPGGSCRVRVISSMTRSRSAAGGRRRRRGRASRWSRAGRAVPRRGSRARRGGARTGGVRSSSASSA